jgi:hypothetical protein
MTTRTHAVELLELDVGMYAPEVGDLLGHLGGHHGVACSFGARDGEGNDGPAVERGEGARFGDAVADLAQLIEPDFAALRQRDHGGGQIGQGLLAGERANGLLAPADLTPTASQIDVRCPKLPVGVTRR